MFAIKTFKPNIFHRLFSSHARKRCIELNRYYLTSKSSLGMTQLAYDHLKSIERRNLLLFKKVIISTVTGVNFELGWLFVTKAQQIKQAINIRRKESEQFRKRNQENAKLIDVCNKWYLNGTQGEKWITYREVDEFIKTYESKLQYLWGTEPSELPSEDGTLAAHINYMREVSSDRKFFRAKCNQIFETNELIKYKIFFDQVLNRPLTVDQRRAIIVDEHAQLVVAAAGSGKTTTIKGKVAYLVNRGLARPDEILIIAFNKNVQKDLSDALKESYPGIGIYTFHAFGLRVLAETRGEMPSLSEFSDSRDKLSKYIDEVIQQIYEKNPNLLNEFFVSYNKPYRDKFDFKSLGEYYNYVRSIGLVTLNNQTVKSLEELELANFLYVNGIRYEYEKSYEHNVSSIEFRQYKPDFYLPDYGIYIEHFAIDVNGNTPHFIDEQKYLQSRDWKIQTHRNYGTKLIETFSHEKRSGILTQNLRENLLKEGVVFAPLPPDQILEKLNSTGYISELGNLLALFLGLFKGSLLSFETLISRINPDDVDAKRAHRFLDIFQQVYYEYQKYLSSQSLIDFNDMIGMATQALKNRDKTTHCKYLLIDEFQDISIGRSEFVKTLLNTSADLKLMAVGDDWQSIYRFSGSDISVMTCFSDHFGQYEHRVLSETFRFDQMVEKVASRFVLKNDAQIKKTIKAKVGSGNKSVILWHPQENNAPILESIAEMIPKAVDGRVQSVLILARYRFYGNEINFVQLKKQRPDIDWIFSTVHSAKGAEADYTILLGVKGGGYSFPSEIADDPLLSLVLAQQDQYPHAEERRLFYVALTRTKNCVYVVGDPTVESLFFEELAKDNDVDTSYLGKTFNRRCSVCQASMVERNSVHGLFFGCTNFPICKNTSKPCNACGVGFLKRGSRFVKCDNDACKSEYSVCPKCEDGTLVTRNSARGLFLGCTNFVRGSCTYTRALNS